MDLYIYRMGRWPHDLGGSGSPKKSCGEALNTHKPPPILTYAHITILQLTSQHLYENTGQLRILTDFERVFDRLDIYLYENWKKGELVEGPIVERHRVKCAFMYRQNEMPNPQGGTRLTENGCKVTFKKDTLLEPRKIESYADYRPGTKKPHFDPTPVWIVEVCMPKPVLKSYGQEDKQDINEDYSFLDESIQAGDLREYVKPVFGVDRYKSKMGEDKDVIVLAFDTKYNDVAKD